MSLYYDEKRNLGTKEGLNLSDKHEIYDRFSEDYVSEYFHLSYKLQKEIEENMLLSVLNMGNYFNKLYFDGIIKLLVKFSELENQFAKLKEKVEEKAWEKRLQAIEKSLFTDKFNLLSEAWGIYNKAKENGITFSHEPETLIYVIFERELNVNMHLRKFLDVADLDIEEFKIPENRKDTFSDCLGVRSRILLPFLIKKYGNAKPGPISQMVIALEGMGLTNGLLNRNKTDLHRILCREINDNLGLRGFSKALKENNPNDPENFHNKTRLERIISSIQKEIEEVIKR